MAVAQAPIAAPGTFGHKLHDVLVARGMGARTLAKAITAAHGGSMEHRRRSIIRWLRGATPVVENRHMVEDVLGLPRDSLKGVDEDDEESSLVAEVYAELRRAIDVLQRTTTRRSTA